ncbi:MAG: O-antigen ligase family protein [Lentimicrobiaceae bacterium]|nr:O-antigen ligase family protein [Lentimicrobiaceae bacterium]MCB9023132.1 O-antigen ligase family protein [Lentimicrobiaceae bacterium]
MTALFKNQSFFKTDVSSLMFYAMILLAMSIPLSEFGMSISQFLLLGLWAWEGADYSKLQKAAGKNFMVKLQAWFSTMFINIGGKFRMLYNNRAAMVVISLYLMHIIGLIYTSDLNYALKDLRIKLPLLSLPVIIATSASLSGKKLNQLLLFFTFAVFAGTIASIFVLITRQISDPREISIFISHIRFGLTICFSVFILIYFLWFNIYKSLTSKIILAIGVLWFLLFLFILESITGLVITGILALIFTFYLIFKINPVKYRIPTILITLLFPALFGYYFVSSVREFSNAEKFDYSKLDKYTKYGTPYIHDTCTYGIDNGKYVGIYLAPAELRQEWNRRSKLDYDGLDKKGQELSYTLIRFLNSKGLRKDAEGVKALTDSEIKHIEQGVANVTYIESFNLRSRIDQIAMGYTNYVRHGDPNASSVMQRVEYWKTSAHIIKQNWLTGVGTGDLNLEFSKAYTEMGSKLDNAFRNRSHNQFMAFFIAFGILGFLWFLFSLLYPPLKLGKFNDYFFVVFFTIIFMSMLTEDTLETQAGATFFAFFNALLLFGRKLNKTAS